MSVPSKSHDLPRKWLRLCADIVTRLPSGLKRSVTAQVCSLPSPFRRRLPGQTTVASPCTLPVHSSGTVVSAVTSYSGRFWPVERLATRRTRIPSPQLDLGRPGDAKQRQPDGVDGAARECEGGERHDDEALSRLARAGTTDSRSPPSNFKGGGRVRVACSALSRRDVALARHKALALHFEDLDENGCSQCHRGAFPVCATASYVGAALPSQLPLGT